MEWWVWMIIGFVVIGLFGDSEGQNTNDNNRTNLNNQNRASGVNVGDVLDVASVVVDDDFDLFG